MFFQLIEVNGWVVMATFNLLHLLKKLLRQIVLAGVVLLPLVAFA